MPGVPEHDPGFLDLLSPGGLLLSTYYLLHRAWLLEVPNFVFGVSCISPPPLLLSTAKDQGRVSSTNEGPKGQDVQSCSKTAGAKIMERFGHTYPNGVVGRNQSIPSTTKTVYEPLSVPALGRLGPLLGWEPAPDWVLQGSREVRSASQHRRPRRTRPRTVFFVRVLSKVRPSSSQALPQS